MGAGQTLTDTFAVVSLDGTASQLVTVTICGTNDAPTITSETASITINESDGALTASGSIAFSDVDTGAAPTTSVTGHVLNATGFALTTAQSDAIVAAFTVDGAGHWSFNLASPDYLPAGSTVTAASTSSAPTMRR